MQKKPAHEPGTQVEQQCYYELFTWSLPEKYYNPKDYVYIPYKNFPELRVVVWQPKKTFLSKCTVPLQLVLVMLLAMCSFGVVLRHSPAGDATAPLHTTIVQVQSVQSVQPLKRVPVHAPVPQADTQQKLSIWTRPQRTLAPGTALMAFVPLSTPTVTDLVVMQLTDFKRFMADAAEASVVVVSVQATQTTAPACVCPREELCARHANNTSNARKDAELTSAVQSRREFLWNGACAVMSVVGTGFSLVVLGTFIGSVTGFGNE